LDGKTLACSTTLDGTIVIFDVAKGKLLHTLEGHNMPVRSLVFPPVDNNVLFTASDDKHIHMYDAKSRVLVSGFSGHASWLLSVDASPEGPAIASGGQVGLPSTRFHGHFPLLCPSPPSRGLACSCSSSSRRSPQSAFPLRSSSCCVLCVLLLLLHVNALLILSLSLARCRAGGRCFVADACSVRSCSILALASLFLFFLSLVVLD
jgi:hypothetical protein